MLPLSGSQPVTVIHRLHPLTKIGCATAVTGLALALNRPMALSPLLAGLLLVMLLGRIRLASRLLLGLLAICALVAAGSLWASGDPSEAARYGLRLLIVAATIPISASTTAAHDLVHGLARLRLPQGLLMAVLVAWRFFPVIADQLRRISEARLLRGGHCRFGAWHRQLMLPLAAITIDHADRVALALEGRGFDVNAKRTWYRPPTFHFRDVMSCVATAAVLMAAVVLEWR